MKSYEAMHRAISKHTLAVARSLHVSTSLVYKWQEPSVDFSAAGAINPLDRVESVMQTCLNEGGKREDALAPLQYLSTRFNCWLLPLSESLPSSKNLHNQLSRCVREFGHLLAESGQALADGVICRDELKRIEAEAEHLIHHVGLFVSQLKRVSDEG